MLIKYSSYILPILKPDYFVYGNQFRLDYLKNSNPEKSDLKKEGKIVQ